MDGRGERERRDRLRIRGVIEGSRLVVTLRTTTILCKDIRRLDCFAFLLGEEGNVDYFGVGRVQLSNKLFLL